MRGREGRRAGTERRYSEETAREIDRAVHALTSAAFDRAVAILQRNRAALAQGARDLLQKETLTEPDIEALKAALRPAPVMAKQRAS